MRRGDEAVRRVGRTTRARWLAVVTALAAACDEAPVEPRPGPAPSPAAVATVEVAPEVVELEVGASRALQATPRARDGRELSDRVVSWRNANPEVVRVDGNGNVTALRPGSVRVSAVVEGKEGAARVEVRAAPPAPGPAPVASVLVTGGGGELEPGEFVKLTATPRAAGGGTLHGRTVSWSSSDESVATVSADGWVVGMRGGAVTITATSEGKTGEARFTLPLWSQGTLRTVGGVVLPAAIGLTSTTETQGSTTVTTERRVRIARAVIQFSTTDLRYRQRLTLQTWERVVTRDAGGNTIAGPERMVTQRDVRDEGIATEYDLFSGMPRYRSTTFPGHALALSRTPTPTGATIDWTVRQRIPGETEGGEYEMVYVKG